MTEQQLNKHTCLVSITQALNEDGADFSTEGRRTLLAESVGHLAHLDDECLALMYNVIATFAGCYEGTNKIGVLQGIVDDCSEDGVALMCDAIASTTPQASAASEATEPCPHPALQAIAELRNESADGDLSASSLLKLAGASLTEWFGGQVHGGPCPFCAVNVCDATGRGALVVMDDDSNWACDVCERSGNAEDLADELEAHLARIGEKSKVTTISVTGTPTDWHLRVMRANQSDVKHRRGYSTDVLVGNISAIFVELPERAPVQLHVFGVSVPWMDIRELADDIRFLCEQASLVKAAKVDVALRHGDVDDVRELVSERLRAARFTAQEDTQQPPQPQLSSPPATSV